MFLTSTPPYDDFHEALPGAGLSRPETNLSPKALHRLTSKSLLCDLRDLCAMLSRTLVFPAQKRCCPPKALRRRTSNSPSVTSVTSVRCFPRRASFPPRSHVVHQKALHRRTPIPFKFETSKISSHVRSRS